MKKPVLVILCLLTFLLTAGAGWVWLTQTPRGVLREDLPDAVMERYLSEKDRAFFRSEYISQIQLPVTEFEDADALEAKLFDATVTDGSVTFRPLSAESAGDVQTYVLTVGGADLFKAVLRYRDRSWSVVNLSALDTIASATHEIQVLVPSDAVVSVNGRTVGEGYILDPTLLYPDMTELELSFGDYPTRTLYAIGGLYEAPVVEASREGSLVLLSANDGLWEYTLPDAAGYAFALSVPSQATVTVGNAVLGPANVAGTSAYVTKLDIPAELLSYLPEYTVYAAGGLYTLPEITAVMPDGTPLSAAESNGVLVYSLPGTDALRDAHHVQPEEFIKALTTYGAGNAPLGSVSPYVAPGSQVYQYLEGALASLHWTAHVTLNIHSVTAYDFIPLGEHAFLCKTEADFTTKTWFQTKDIVLHHEMLWIEQDGVWRLWDMAFI